MSAPGVRRPTVVYVMGAGRSGSTILGVLLGNVPGCFYAGELDAWLSRDGEPNFGGGERERFWAGVRAEMPPCEDLFGDRCLRRVEHSSAVFRPRLPFRRRSLQRRYREIAGELFAAIASRSGAGCVIDTSHYPLRARELRKAGANLFLIYLRRRPEAVVSAFSRRDVMQPSKRPLAANAYLLVTHLLSVATFLRHPAERRFQLAYEDLLADPERVLGQLLEQLGAESDVPRLDALQTGVAFQGNRLLRSSQVSFHAGSPGVGPRRPLTRLVQLPWTVLLPRLRPGSLADAERASEPTPLPTPERI